MGARWFRFYSDAMRHPKVAKLSDRTFRLWVELLSVASENDGEIPSVNDLKHVLKRRLDHLLTGIEELLRASLIEPSSDGYKPHGWEKRQYKSDTSTDRVRKHRKKGNVSVTSPDTDTDTDTVSSLSNERKETVEAAQARSQSILNSSTGKRGARLPDDFRMPEEWIIWAMDNRRWPRRDVCEERDAFIDYWRAKAGKDASKLDWSATWRNWIRNSRRQPSQPQIAI